MDKIFIEKVQITGLWGKFDIDWKLDPKVNILIGKNGTGKSTILKIIESSINNTGLNKSKFKLSGIVLSNNERVINRNIDFTVLQDEKGVENLIKELIENDLRLKASILPEKEERSNLKNTIKLMKISTFDMELIDKKNIKSNKDEKIKTELDLVLEELINNFKLYQLKLKNLVEKESNIIDDNIKNLGDETSDLLILKKLVQEKEKKVNLIFENKDKFINILNQLFKDTNKVLDLDENNSIIFRAGEQVITPYQLSSGEKQMLIILLTIILKENKPFVLLMDEPEISLHVEWQRDFLDNLISLNPNMQIILATHSPAIVSKGWMDKVVNILDIVSKVE